MTDVSEVWEAGVYGRMRGVLGDSGAQAFVREFSGERVCVPTVESLLRMSVAAACRHHFDRGVPVKELCERFGISRRTVCRYLNFK